MSQSRRIEALREGIRGNRGFMPGILGSRYPLLFIRQVLGVWRPTGANPPILPLFGESRANEKSSAQAKERREPGTQQLGAAAIAELGTRSSGRCFVPQNANSRDLVVE